MSFEGERPRPVQEHNVKNPPQTGAHQGQNAMPPMGEEEIIGDASFSGSIGRMGFFRQFRTGHESLTRQVCQFGG
jgi:hypothetical protein